MSDQKLRTFFRTHARAVSYNVRQYLEPLYEQATREGVTKGSFASFRRHYSLWLQHRGTHVPPPVATAPLQEAYA